VNNREFDKDGVLLPSEYWKNEVKSVFRASGVEVLRDMTNPVDIIGKPILALTRKMKKFDLNIDFVKQLNILKIAVLRIYDHGDDLVLRAHYEKYIKQELNEASIQVQENSFKIKQQRNNIRNR
jgi:hypothetical protein